LAPLVASVLLLIELPEIVQLAIAGASAFSMALGVLVERWLFFAEAEHVVAVYYRGGSA
jgi:sulfite dehydrogenase (quinone) subunit SoeC